MKKRCSLLMLLPMLLLLVISGAYAADVVPSKDYPFPDESALPPILYVGVPMECGKYKIQLISQPVVTKSMQAIVADNDMKYLIARVGITNTGETTTGWLTPDSFVLSEYYRNREYGRTDLNSLMSARIAPGYTIKPFYSALEPGKMMLTALVFDVYPEAEGWILTFAPHVFGEDTGESVRFRLPKAVVQ